MLPTVHLLQRPSQAVRAMCMKPGPVAPDPWGLAHLLSDLHCPGHWFLVFKNSPHEICHMGYISPKGQLCWFAVLNHHLNDTFLHGRIGSRLGNVCCQVQVPLLLRAVWEEPGRRVHSQGQHLKLLACSQKDQSSLNGHIDREGAGQLSGSSDAEGKGRERNGKTLKAFSFQPPLRILNAFYPDMFEVCILLSV